RPNWFRAVTLEARFADLEAQLAGKDYDPSALKQYRKAIEIGERKPEIVKLTVGRLMKDGRLSEARQVLEIVKQSSPQASPYDRENIELSLMENKKSQDFIKEAKATVRADSKDYREHLWLA